MPLVLKNITPKRDGASICLSNGPKANGNHLLEKSLFKILLELFIAFMSIIWILFGYIFRIQIGFDDKPRRRRRFNI
jgi:hypothetical protein